MTMTVLAKTAWEVLRPTFSSDSASLLISDVVSCCSMMKTKIENIRQCGTVSYLYNRHFPEWYFLRKIQTNEKYGM